MGKGTSYVELQQKMEEMQQQQQQEAAPPMESTNQILQKLAETNTKISAVTKMSIMSSSKLARRKLQILLPSLAMEMMSLTHSSDSL